VASRLPYRLGPSLGFGGYAEVFRAEHRDRPAATVAFKRDHGRAVDGAKRLRREISVQQVLNHPNLMPVLDADPGEGWYTMPLAIGSLRWLFEDGRLGADAREIALDVAEQVSQGLGYAHEQGYLHRDVSPGNILGFEQTDGTLRWVVGDWGTVRRPLGETTTPLTDPGEGLGTAGFAAPETYDIDAHAVDERADVYSLGRVVAWVLTGRWPAPNRPLLPDGDLRGFVVECTDLDPVRRPASMGDLRARLQELLAEPPTSNRGRIQELLEATAITTESAREALRIALLNPDDDEIWVDEIARIPIETIRQLARESPDLADEAALGLHGLAEDLATTSFVREVEMDRWPQQRITVAWARTLEEPEGRVIRNAIRRSRAHPYFASAFESGRILSRSLAAEFGR
jgi:serine/threonine-protein kinase